MVDTYNLLLAGTEGASNSLPALSPAQYQLLGLASVDTTAEANLLNQVLDTFTTSQVGTFAELNQLANVVQGIMTIAAGGTASPALSASDLTALGLTGITADTLNAVLAAIAATADNGTGVDSLAELQAIADAAALTWAQAVSDLSNYAGTGTAPTASTWSLAGVQGVTNANLGAVNAFLAPVSTAQSNSTAELQAIADAVNSLLAGADGSNNDNLSLTAAQYQLLGAASIDTPAEVSLLNDVVDIQLATAVDSPAELAALAQTVSGVLATAAGTVASPALTASALSAIGVAAMIWVGGGIFVHGLHDFHMLIHCHHLVRPHGTRGRFLDCSCNGFGASGVVIFVLVSVLSQRAERQGGDAQSDQIFAIAVHEFLLL